MAATTQKTIEYMLPMLGSGGSTGVASSTTHTDSGDTTLYIPETTSRAFKSVTLKVTANDCYGTAGNDLAAWSVRCSCDAGSNWTTVTRTTTLADTGEQFPLVMVADVTAEFTARFSGASDTCRWGLYVSFSGTGSIWSNAAASLIITYEYDATAHTTAQVKTVRIPIESFNGRLSNTAQEIRQGTIVNQLPALTHASTPFLPEASVTLRQAFCELWSNTLPSTTTDTYLYVKIDSGGAETQSGIIEGALSTPIPLRFLYDVTTVDWTAARALYARHDVAAQSYIALLGGWMTVTYEYNPATTTTVLNSIIIGTSETLTEIRASGDKSMFNQKFYVEEPDTVTLVQSGVFCAMQTVGTSDTFTLKIGSQTATGYTPTSGANMAGQTYLTHRIDSGGYRGEGITLARGENTITFEYYIGTAGRVGTPSLMTILNYKSGKSGSYGESNARTLHYLIKAQSTTPSATYSATQLYTPNIIEANYWLVGASMDFNALWTGTTVVGHSYFVERQAGEGVAAGWEDIDTYLTTGTAEIGYTQRLCCICRIYKRHPNDLDTNRLNIETARTYYIYLRGIVTQLSIGMWVTYHSNTFTVSGNVAGSSGGTVTLNLHRDSDGELLATTTRTGDGAYSFTWYDSAQDLYVQAYEDGSHKGRSNKGKAT